MQKSNKNLWASFTIAIIMLFQMNWFCDCCLESERIGLLHMNSVFNFSKRVDLDADCCSWEIVECNATSGHVTVLYLDGLMDYNWYLNASLFLPFQQLNEIDLSYNKIAGCIRNEGFERLSTLTNLELLDLSYNQFNTTKNFLQNIGKIRSLKTLNLDACGLSGNIPSSQGLCQLKHLQQLYMHGNDFSSNLPWCLANLTSLRYLDLSDNRFSGNISLSPLQSLTSLQYLHLSDNLFQIPTSLASLFNFSQLIELYVGNNKIYADTDEHNLNPKFQLEILYIYGYGEGEGEGGPIPKFLHYQHNLEILEISDIKLSGRFPYWLLENNTNLRNLYLTNNSLSGNIQLPTNPHVRLETLDISDNFFTGCIPSQIGVFLPSISVLSMSQNEFNGSLPETLCNYVSSLYELEISHNISGTLPKCMGNMTRLEILNLSNNNISGSLPSKFRSLSIAIVYLSKNRLQGSLKAAFYYCSAMFLLDLSHNNFSGRIPSWIQTLSYLVYLDLGYNSFQRKIPIELCKLKELSFLDLSHNNISGHIPTCLNTTSFWSRTHASIQYGNLEFVVKGRTYVYDERILKFISGIDISCNNLTGEIPLNFGNLSNIKVLNLSHNGLIGMIPMTFSNLKEIESLDLSHNNLQGAIPRQLTQLTSLEVFNVSYNNLSGQTPNQVAQFATFDESCYRGNPFLCGCPLPKSCFTTESPTSNAKISPDEDESADTFVDMESFYVSFGVAYATVLLTLVAVLCINPYWRRVWFYYVQMSIDKIWYFIIDNVIPLFARF